MRLIPEFVLAASDCGMTNGFLPSRRGPRSTWLLVLAMTTLVILGTARSVGAQSYGYDREVYLGAGASSTTSLDGGDFGGGFHFVGGFGMRQSRHVVFALELVYTSRTRDFGGGIVRLEGEDLALDAHVMLLALVDKRAQPYASLGAGLLRSHTESLRHSDGPGAADQTSQEVVTREETAWGPHLRIGAGLQVFLADSFTLRAEWRWRLRYSEAFPGIWNELGVTLGYQF